MIARLLSRTPWAGAAVLLAAAAGGAQAQALDDAAPRARLARERAAVEARHEQRVAACSTRFVVTDCVEQAHRDRVEALRPLREQGLRMDDALRKRRADQRRDLLRAKAAEAAQSPPSAAPAGDSSGESKPEPKPASKRAPVARSERPPAPDSPPSLTPAVGASSRVPEASTEPGSGTAASDAPKSRHRQHRRDHATELERERLDREKRERLQRELDRRREVVEQRQAQRLRSGKAGIPLPVPDAAAARPASDASR